MTLGHSSLSPEDQDLAWEAFLVELKQSHGSQRLTIQELRGRLQH